MIHLILNFNLLLKITFKNCRKILKPDQERFFKDHIEYIFSIVSITRHISALIGLKNEFPNPEPDCTKKP